MNRNDGVRGVVLTREHLLCFGSVNLCFKRIEGLGQVAGHILTALCPLEEHAKVVDLLGKAVAELDVFSQAPLAL
jgi:hypothetical protein